MSWRSRAKCRDEDPELFFPVGHHRPARVRLAAAKSVCGQCPVSADCLEWALANGEVDGVWGGTSEDERRDLGRRAERAAQS
ncbi:WhiB family transcriptional regulator [Actinomycetospora flava]|uniref:Transcriptional regulator WhiB n=1 Tax=Actinomycetospora flava TaxID=3129232 RepID=A0ABU8MER2_9PSEU